MDLIQVVYQSVACQALAGHEVLEILRKSQSKNQRKQISGILLYRNGRFLQFLEGPESAVDELLETISQDSRHQALEIVERRHSALLLMPTWAMGYFSPELDTESLQDAFILKEANARAICEMLPDYVGQHFLSLLDQGAAAA